MTTQAAPAGQIAPRTGSRTPGPPAPRGTAQSAQSAQSSQNPQSNQGRRSGPRPVPRRSEVYGHLSVDALRRYRTALTAEENNVSYWRRILQARLDVVMAGAGSRELDTDRLRPVLTSDRVDSGRRALVQVLQVDDIPPLPSLAELWERQVAADDEVGRNAFAEELHAAEVQLSEYRKALHKRIGDSTGELIARYREQPDLCLTALPREPGRRVGA